MPVRESKSDVETIKTIGAKGDYGKTNQKNS